jgi:serine/threonine protein kinase
MTASDKPVTETPSTPLIPGAVLQDRYRIVRQLGRGGMGAVYEAEDQRLGITIALKETLSAEASMRRQFEHEARLLAGMQHPALPRVSDHFVEGNRAFLVMQFIGGFDLARIISQQPGPFPRDQVIAWADQLLDALIYLHSRDRQVIHRDIKPHNLKLSSSGQIALLDFGLAKAQPADSSVTSSRGFFGYTRHYAPLEQIQDQRTDPRSDIYALGATLYHLLTGVKPPDALVRASALINGERDPLQTANKINAAVGSEIAAILNKAMAQKSEDRYATADEFREALRKLGRVGLTKEVVVKARVAAVNQPVDDTELTVVALRAGSSLNMAMVESKRQFGPGAFTALLVLAGVLVTGLVYGSKWLQSGGKVSAATSEKAVTAGRPSGLTRKIERPRGLNSLNVAPVKTRTEDNSNVGRIDQKREALIVDSRTPGSKAGSSRESETPRSQPPTPRSRVDAPSIRLPNPDVADNSAALSRDEGILTYGRSEPAPKFFRAADGTYTVKFSDGSTRVVRPGGQKRPVNLKHN